MQTGMQTIVATIAHFSGNATHGTKDEKTRRKRRYKNYCKGRQIIVICNKITASKNSLEINELKCDWFQNQYEKNNSFALYLE